MRLSPQTRNPVRHRSASVEIANQTGDRVLTIRLQVNYKNRSNLWEARVQILYLFFVGLAVSLFSVGGLLRLSATVGRKSESWLVKGVADLVRLQREASR